MSFNANGVGGFVAAVRVSSEPRTPMAYGFVAAGQRTASFVEGFHFLHVGLQVLQRLPDPYTLEYENAFRTCCDGPGLAWSRSTIT